MDIHGKIRLHRTCGKFSEFVKDNAAVFRRYFGADLFPGSLNIDTGPTRALQEQLDRGNPRPSFVIPRAEMGGKWMPNRLGNGQAWACTLHTTGAPPISCWVFRRIKSGVPPGVLEIVATVEIVRPYKLPNGHPVRLELAAGDSRTQSSVATP